MPDELTQEPESQESPTSPTTAAKRGLPIWMPLAGLLMAFAFAILIGGMVCPTLSALVFPPEPPLPPGDVTTTESKNTGFGRDEWVYATNIPACSVYKYYLDRIGGCNYDPDARCGSPTFGIKPRDGASYLVGVCQGAQTVGLGYKITWTIRIGGGYAAPNTTIFRVTREVTN